MNEDAYQEISELVKEHMRLEFERIERSASKTLELKKNDLATTGNLRSGHMLKVIGEVRAEALARWGEALWSIISQSLEATCPVYSPGLEEQLRNLVRAHFTDPPAREHQVFEQEAKRVGLSSADIARFGRGVLHELDVASNQARREVERKLSLEMVRRRREGEKTIARPDKASGIEMQPGSSTRENWIERIKSHPFVAGVLLLGAIAGAVVGIVKCIGLVTGLVSG